MDNAPPAREHKDRLFRALFGDEKNKRNTLELYNAVNNSSYTNEDDITLTMIDDAIYLGMKNDISFLIADTLQLYEHQSTVNPNMPVRGLVYFGKLYAKYLETYGPRRLYGSTQIKLPTPKYVVFYNGAREQPDRLELKLTDAFVHPEESCIEVTAIMLNINYGHNSALMKRSETLQGYAYFISRVREYTKTNTLEQAVSLAIENCISNGVLNEYLSVHKAEVIGMLTKEYSNAEIAEMFFENGLEQGREEGREELLADLLAQGLLTSDAVTRYRAGKAATSSDNN